MIRNLLKIHQESKKLNKLKIVLTTQILNSNKMQITTIWIKTNISLSIL